MELNGGIDRVIGEWKLIDVHIIPEIFNEFSEVDFYCCNDKEVYLLRVRSRKNKKLSIEPDRMNLGYPTYLVAEYDFKTLDNQVIRIILKEFTEMIND
ncbi:MAG: hypothetical protein KGV59_04780 [Tenacibaculum sp.]|nr:hypothetical protein [Tenacibaculum sp.]